MCPLLSPRPKAKNQVSVALGELLFLQAGRRIPVIHFKMPH